jgi:uncharacterized membrane protein
MSGMFLILATFLAATIEGVEMMAILVGEGAARGWRSTLLGAAAGFALLAGLTFTLGNALPSSWRSKASCWKDWKLPSLL